MTTRLGIIVVFEGPDCAGKTTAAKKIARNIDANYYRMTNRFIPSMFWYMTAVFRRIEQDVLSGKNVVLDRFWMSDSIYGKVFNRDPYYPQQGRTIDRLYKKYNYIGVLCKPWSEVEEQVAAHAEQKDPNHPYKDADYRYVVECYDEVAEKILEKKKGSILGPDNYMHDFTGSNWLVYDYRKDPTAIGLLRQITPLSQRYDWDKACLLSCSGSIKTAKRVILTDCIHKNHKINYPLHDRAGDSLLISNTFQQLEMQEDDYLFASAYDQRVFNKQLIEHLFKKYGAENILVLSYGLAKTLRTYGFYDFHVSIAPRCAIVNNQVYRLEEGFRRFINHDKFNYA
jgi:thymidylate kinase